MSLNLSSINLSKFNEMKAIKILQTLFNGGLLPSACTIEGGKYILKDCAASPNLYTIVEGDVLPEKDYLCIRDSYVLPFTYGKREGNVIVYKSLGKTYFCFEIEE